MDTQMLELAGNVLKQLSSSRIQMKRCMQWVKDGMQEESFYFNMPKREHQETKLETKDQIHEKP